MRWESKTIQSRERYVLQTSYPGVYIVEKSSGVNTITGVATSVGAFFGRTAKGPINKPVRCFSYADFLRNFGGANPHSELAASLKLFFDNGGSDTYVVRLAGGGALAAGIDLRTYGGADVLRASAKMQGRWGNGLRLEVDYRTANPGESFNLSVIHEEGGKVIASEVHSNLVMDPAAARFAPAFVSQSSALIDLALVPGFNLAAGAFAGFSEARRPLGADLGAVQATLDGMIAFGTASGARRFEISVDGSAYVTVDLTDWDATDAAIADVGDLSAQLSDQINDALATLVPAPTVAATITPSGATHFLRIASATAEAAVVHIRRSPASDIAGALMLGVDNGGVELSGRSPFRPAASGNVFRMSDNGGALGGLNALAALTQDELATITIANEDPVVLDSGSGDIQTTGAGDLFTRDALGAGSANGNNDGVREKLQIIAGAITNAAGSRYRAELQGHDLVVRAKDGSFNQLPGNVAFAGTGAGAINPTLVRNTRQYPLGPGSASNFIAFDNARQNGNDGAAPGFADYVGSPVDKTGFNALDTVDLFNLMVLPKDDELSEQTYRSLWGPASIYVQSRRAFLMIDAPDSWSDAEGRPAIVQSTDDINNLRATVVKDHSAVFYPRIKVKDGNLTKIVGSAGAVAGLAARTDANRGVWKAFAGTEADLRGIVGLATKLTDLENGVLNKLGVNCARQFPAGYVSWGARTLAGSDDLGSEWKYIPIRRLALMIEESLYRGTQWAVFEPNDEPLWAKLRLNVGVFMNGLFRQGAFQGSTKSEAYFVKCDSETTPQADRNLGIVNVEVGFAPLKPAEFVVITIQQIAGDLS